MLRDGAVYAPFQGKRVVCQVRLRLILKDQGHVVPTLRGLGRAGDVWVRGTARV